MPPSLTIDRPAGAPSRRAVVAAAFASVLVGLAVAGCGGGGAAPPPPSAPIGRVVNTSLASTKTGYTYPIQIYLPASYDSGSATYPVVYALDGDAAFVDPDTRFTHFERILQQLGTNSILVGIGGTVRRQTDYNFPGAYAYHDFVALELIPLIEATYRADPTKRMLSGLSTSANFALSALFIEAPGHLVFADFISAEGAFWQQQDELYALEQEMFNGLAGTPLPVTVILAKSSFTDTTNAPYVQAMYDRMNARHYAGLQLLTTTFADGHAAVDDPAFQDAIVKILGQ